MQIVSLAWGILAILSMFVGLIPCLGALNWLVIPFSFVGFVVSLIAHVQGAPGRKTGSLAGIVLCAAATVIGLIRLKLGAGIL
jgi:hypothetical protein